MKKNLLLVSSLWICFFICGCNNTNTPVVDNIEPSEVQCAEEECLDNIVDELDVNEPTEDVIIPEAEKLDQENEITASEVDLDSASVAESDIFEEDIN